MHPGTPPMPFLGYRYNSHNNIKREKKKEKRLIREYYEPKTKKLTGHNKPFRKHAWLQRKHIYKFGGTYACMSTSMLRVDAQVRVAVNIHCYCSMIWDKPSIQFKFQLVLMDTKFEGKMFLIFFTCYIKVLHIF